MTQVVCVNEFDAVHRWATCAASHPHSYLANPHRHRFCVETAFSVGHDDREIEIFEMQDSIDALVRGRFASRGAVLDFEDSSCESIARMIADALRAEWCEVREDGRGGARYVREQP